MTTQITTTEKKLDLKGYFYKPAVKKRFEEVLGSKAQNYIISILSLAGNTKVAECDPATVVNAAMTAALLDLPINPNLGLAYIIPYGLSATLQIGWKGFVELSIRSGQFLTINVTDVKEGEIKRFNRLTGVLEFEWLEENRDKSKTVGYVSFFKLLNGFEKMFYMTTEELEKHAKRYSKSYTSPYAKTNVWKDDFDAMCRKTVIKLLLNRFAPKSIQMQRAILADQAIIKDDNTYEYIDNEQTRIEKALESDVVLEEKEIELINKAETIAELTSICAELKGKGPDFEKPILKEYTRRKKEIENENN